MTTYQIKRQLDAVFEKNELIADLSAFEFDLDEATLKYILEQVKKHTFIGSIKWNQAKIKSAKLIGEIENALIENNNNYREFPSDYTHCLLSRHVYNYPIVTEKNENARDLDIDVEATKSLGSNTAFPRFQKLVNEEWTVKRVEIQHGYKCILYMNKK